MHRIAILVASFLLAIVGLIFLQGGRDSAPRVAAVEPEAEQTDVTDLSAPPMPGTVPAAPPAPVAAAPPTPPPPRAAKWRP